MSEYLTKEEIKQWRSSLEKITLEEFAARLGKQIEEAKHTNDLVDIVLKGKPYTSSSTEMSSSMRSEKINTIAEKAVEKERQIVSSSTPKTQPKAVEVKAQKEEKEVKKQQPIIKETAPASLKEEVQIVFKKALTDREQLVFDYFLKNKNQIVYAKDLANLLSLPRDYVYKYIKNLRAKIEGENLQNADKGGFILN